MNGVKEGCITEPIPLSAVGAKRPTVPRCAIPDQHGDGPKKDRLIDDFRASGLNDTVSMGDADIPQGVGGFLAMWSDRQRLHNGRELIACSVDLAHSYKHVPVSTAKVINKEDE